MWFRELEVIEILNIIFGYYNMFCRVVWKNRKNFFWLVFGELEGFKYYMEKMFFKGLRVFIVLEVRLEVCLIYEFMRN